MKFPLTKDSPLSLFEFWPNSIFYIPVFFFWFLKAFEHRGIATSLLANPRIETGGLCGESKSAILNMAGDTAKTAIAPYITFRNSPHALTHLKRRLSEQNFSFPLVIKPDIGSNGTGVRKINSESDLKKTLSLFPYGNMLIAQELIDFPLEAGIFFIRHPNEKHGKITSITYKEVPVLIGDGHSSLLSLALQNKRIRKLFPLYLPYLRKNAGKILAKNEKYPLVFAGNHRRGSIFWNGTADLTSELEKAINKILLDIPHFFFGRIDLKVKSKNDLLRGQHFKIIEINGVGSEATHIWDRKTKLIDAYRDQFYHYGMAFKIGNYLKNQSWTHCSIIHFLKSWQKHKKLTALYPKND
ncbi:ATP-grasp domain-containing protein [Acetobacteraceae bacterium]|nr:ATP-grasp domain-containing protein [Acetobacteraceae bacterium]